MSGKRAAGLVLIVVGVVAALYLRDSTGPLAIGAGAVLALIGLVLAAQKDTMATQTVQPVPSLPPSPALLASLMAQSQVVAASFANQELLAVVVGHLQTGHKINAIKALREVTHCGLKEGKDLVDEVDRALKNATRGV